jgi:hypothetical protein
MDIHTQPLRIGDPRYQSQYLPVEHNIQTLTWRQNQSQTASNALINERTYLATYFAPQSTPQEVQDFTQQSEAIIKNAYALYTENSKSHLTPTQKKQQWFIGSTPVRTPLPSALPPLQGAGGQEAGWGRLPILQFQIPLRVKHQPHDAFNESSAYRQCEIFFEKVTLQIAPFVFFFNRNFPQFAHAYQAHLQFQTYPQTTSHPYRPPTAKIIFIPITPGM